MAFGAEAMRAMLAASPDVVFVLRRDGRIAFASANVRKFVGDEDVVGAHMSVLLPERLHNLFGRFLSEYLCNPIPRLVGARQPIFFITPDGECQVEIALNALERDGESLAVLSVRDISMRVPRDEGALQAFARLERRLQNALHELGILIEHAPAAIAVLDNDLRYMIASDRWLTDFGLPKDIVGKRHLDLFPDLPERWQATLRLCLEGQTIGSEDDYFDREDGTRDYLRWEVIPWRLPDGAVGGITIFSEVTTKRRLAELAVQKNQALLERLVDERTLELASARDAAKRAEAIKSRLVAAASHDLRQPLHSLGLMLEALERRQTDLEAEALCQRAQNIIDHATDTLSALLDSSRLEDGVLRAKITHAALQPMLQAVMRTHQAAAAAKGISLDVAPCLIEVETDVSLFSRILDNFVGNAIKYTERGGVAVTCACDGKEVTVHVSDTGRGIDPVAVREVFDPYVQIEDQSGRRGEGVGLGLAICKTIADALHCRLSVSSELGVGSTFSVSVAVAQPGLFSNAS